MNIKFNSLEQAWIVAEIGVNHEGNEAVAEDLIFKAADAGADAVKFQTFEIEHYISTEQPERRERTSGFQLPREAFSRLAKVAKEAGVIFFSTPLGLNDVEFLAELAPVIKISSGDLTFLDLICRAAQTGKPMIISTGLGTEDEIAEAVETVLTERPSAETDGSLVLLHCIAAYPTPADDANLRNMNWLARRFGLPIGFSDHTLGVKACELAVAAGAQVIEKHFTYRKENQAFHDHNLSADPVDLKELVEAIRTAETYLGTEVRARSKGEIDVVDHMRRSIGATTDLPAGTPLQREWLTWLRPAWGLGPEDMDSVVGRTLNKPVPAGALIRAEDLADSQGDDTK